MVAGIHTYEASIGGLQNERSAGQAITKIEPSLQSLGQVRDPTQEAVARYTYWLTLFTAVLAASTIALWWTTKASVNTLAGAERAYVKMSHKAPGLDFFEERYISVTLVVTNFGRTPAKVTDTLLKPVLTPAGECLPDEPNYSRDRGMPSSKAFLVANDHFIIGENFVFEPDTPQKLQDSELWLYLIGSLITWTPSGAATDQDTRDAMSPIKTRGRRKRETISCSSPTTLTPMTAPGDLVRVKIGTRD